MIKKRIVIRKYLDKFLFWGITTGAILYCTTAHCQQKTDKLSNKMVCIAKDINNIDSIFDTNFCNLYAIVGNNEKEVEIQNHDILEFISVVCMMSGIDFINDIHKPIKMKKGDIATIHYWYIRNKKKITLDILKRFYTATRTYCFESYNEILSFFDDLDNYVICDIAFKNWFSSNDEQVK